MHTVIYGAGQEDNASQLKIAPKPKHKFQLTAGRQGGREEEAERAATFLLLFAIKRQGQERQKKKYL